MDFDTAFLQSDPLSEMEHVWISLPVGLPRDILEKRGWVDGQVLHLRKPLYGLK